MATLKIRDKDGNVQEVPVIKGDKGPKGDKGEQGIQGVAGKDAVTDQTYNPNSPNAQSGKAVAEALCVFEEIPIENVGDFTPRDTEITYGESDNGTYKVIDVVNLDNTFTLACTEIGNVFIMMPSYILPNLAIGCKIYIEFGEQKAADAYHINKLAIGKDEYVTENIKIKHFQNYNTVYVRNNIDFVASEKINEIFIEYPETDFICSIYFTLVESDYISIVFPKDTKYVGGIPEFKNGETWELNIKNGVVVAGKVEEAHQ